MKKKGTNLERVTYLVFDEADRMFDMGFVCELMVHIEHFSQKQNILIDRNLKCVRLQIMSDLIDNVYYSVQRSKRKWKN